MARLRAENAKVGSYPPRWTVPSQRYAQVRQMMGADIVRDPVGQATQLPVAPPIRARLASAAARRRSESGLVPRALAAG